MPFALLSEYKRRTPHIIYGGTDMKLFITFSKRSLAAVLLALIAALAVLSRVTALSGGDIDGATNAERLDYMNSLGCNVEETAVSFKKTVIPNALTIPATVSIIMLVALRDLIVLMILCIQKHRPFLWFTRPIRADRTGSFFILLSECRCDFYAADRSYREYITASCTKHALNLGFISIEHFIGHISLDRACKTAAMDSERAF